MISEPPFMSPQDLARLDGLNVSSVRMAEGRLPGKHRSRLQGGCAEFAEHRAYGLGDEVRRLDWRVLAKSDRYFVKQFNEESVLVSTLVVDAAAGMGFAESGPSKWDAARAVTSGLARLLLAQRDPVGLALAASPLPPLLPARSEAPHYGAMMEVLRRTVPRDGKACGTAFGNQRTHPSARSGGGDLRCSFVIWSRWRSHCGGSPHCGHQLVLFHTVAPEELSFPYKDGIRFVSLEDDSMVVPLDAPSFRKTYLARLNAHLSGLRKLCAGARCDYVPLRTDQSPAAVLADYLRERSRRMQTFF